MKVIFPDLPKGATIVSIGGMAIDNLTAAQICEQFPHWFKTSEERTGKVLSSLSFYGTPFIELTYVVGAGPDTATIFAKDAPKTDGDRGWHPGNVRRPH